MGGEKIERLKDMKSRRKLKFRLGGKTLIFYGADMKRAKNGDIWGGNGGKTTTKKKKRKKKTVKKKSKKICRGLKDKKDIKKEEEKREREKRRLLHLTLLSKI